MVTIRSIGKRGADIGFGQLWIVGDDLSVRHSRRQPSQYVGDGDTHPADTRPLAPLSGFLCDGVAIISGQGFMLARSGGRAPSRGLSACAMGAMSAIAGRRFGDEALDALPIG